MRIVRNIGRINRTLLNLYKKKIGQKEKHGKIYFRLQSINNFI